MKCVFNSPSFVVQKLIYNANISRAYYVQNSRASNNTHSYVLPDRCVAHACAWPTFKIDVVKLLSNLYSWMQGPGWCKLIDVIKLLGRLLFWKSCRVPRISCFVWKEQKLARAGKETAEGTTNMAPVRNVQCAALVNVKRTAFRFRRSLRKLQCYIQAPATVETAQQVMYV
jgi:hypothetical protein